MLEQYAILGGALADTGEDSIDAEAPPCSLEDYTQVHAAMSYRGDATAARVLASLGLDATTWLACQVYWSPRVASNVDPKFDIAAAIRFRDLMKLEIQKLAGRKQP